MEGSKEGGRGGGIRRLFLVYNSSGEIKHVELFHESHVRERERDVA